MKVVHARTRELAVNNTHKLLFCWWYIDGNAFTQGVWFLDPFVWQLKRT